MKGVILMLFLTSIGLVSCVGDQRKAQWHCNLIMVRQHEIVDVWNRWDRCFADTMTFRYLTEKHDSIVLLLNRFDQTLDTLTLPDNHGELVQASKQWCNMLRNQLLPLYHNKNDNWKMMSLWWDNSKTQEWKETEQAIEDTKRASNDQMNMAMDEFVDEFNLSFSTP